MEGESADSKPSAIHSTPTSLASTIEANPSADPTSVSDSFETIEAPWDDASANSGDERLREIQTRLQESPPFVEPEILRVNQLDANLLDMEIENVFKNQMIPALRLIRPSYAQDYLPEFMAFFRMIMFYFSLWSTNSTYGGQLQNLRYHNQRSFSKNPLSKGPHDLSTLQKIGYALCYVGVPWIWSRVSLTATIQGWSSLPEDTTYKRIWRMMDRMETAFKTASLLNFIVFLYNGRYHHIADRLLGVRLVYIRPIMARNVSFEIMHRQLFLQEFFNFFFFLISLVNVSRIKESFYGSLNRFQGGQITSSIPAHVCLICRTDNMTMPHMTDCGHLYCYYCIQSNIMGDPRYACPRCGQVVQSVERYMSQ